MVKKKSTLPPRVALGGSKKRWWMPFKARTPLGHLIEGYLCKHRKAGTLAGALHVLFVDGEPCNQVLYGMPEIPYPEQTAVVVPGGSKAVSFTRKLDGTALLFSAIKLPSKEYEVFPRTRGMPVLVNTKYRAWRDVVGEVLDDPLRQGIREACIQQSATLAFELWGKKNRHSVTYEQELALSLHSVIRSRGVSPWSLVALLGKSFKIPLVPLLERVSKPTADQIVSIGAKWQERYEALNDPEQGLYREEGVVALVETGQQGRLWKFKPPSMAEFHRLARRKIRGVTIRHEAFKILESDQCPSLANLSLALGKIFGHNEVEEQRAFIEEEYWSWCQEAEIQGLRENPEEESESSSEKV
ncbi:MAG: hypothetical protein P1V97_07605 [Planctomycetota bacterium]|nr:hypothetical protein [Planctomycetota bacterium]